MAEEVSLRKIANAFAAYGQHLANAFGGKCELWSDVSVSYSRLPSEFHNMVVSLRPLEPSALTRLMEELNVWFPNPHWTLWSVFPLPGVNELEYRFDSQLMYADHEMYREPPKVPGLTIEEIVDDAGVHLFEQVRELAISDSRIPSWGSGAVSPLDARILGHGYRRWIGRLDGEVVATAAAFDDGTFNMIKNVATRHEYRKRGIGAAMTHVACTSSSRPAVFDTDPGAESLYHRLGFVGVGRMQFWAPKLP